MKTLSTKEKLKMVGKEEFLAFGFKDASLRTIGKKAGFTLGAFYGYYTNKEALFEDLVSDAAERLYQAFLNVQNLFAALSNEEQIKQLDTFSGEGLWTMVEMFFQDPDIYKILFFRSAGTSYEDFLKKFIAVEIKSTREYMMTLKQQGYPVDIDDHLIEMIASAQLSGFVEVLNHDMNKEKAMKYLRQLRQFHLAGWQQLFHCETI